MEHFEHLYAAYRTLVLQLAFRITNDRQLSEDVMQETFIKAYTRIDSLKHPEKARSWILTICRRTALNMIRERERWNGTPIESSKMEQYTIERNQEDHALHSENKWILERVLEELPKLSGNSQKIFSLKFFHHMEDAAIAETLQIKQGTIKSRIHRTRKKLREKVYGN